MADFLYLLDHPLLLLVILTVGGLIGVGVERLVSTQERARRRAYWQGRNAGHGGAGHRRAAQPGNLNAADQLRCVMEADFTARSLLNRAESTVFKALDTVVVARHPGWQVMAQVSLGEFLSSDDKQAYAAVNSKRVDFALMDPDCRVRHAIEYQGSGHHLPGGAAAARDAVKKEALRKAGIGYHEVVAGHTTPSDLRRLVERLIPAR